MLRAMVYLPLLIVALSGEVSQSDFVSVRAVPTAVETPAAMSVKARSLDSSNSSMAVSND